MNSRRTFLKHASLFAATVAVSPSFACSPLQKSSLAKHPIGLQLYSLRDVIKNDINGIITKVAAIGYKEVETYGYSAKNGFWGLKANEFADLLQTNGITSPSGHFDMESYITGKNTDSLKSFIDAANILKSAYVTVPWLNEPVRKTADDYKKIAQKLNVAGETCKAAGLKIAYHNHDFEFKKFGETNGYEILLKETDPKLVDFELDLYWTVRSNVKPLDLFKAHPKRFTMFHVKDIDKSNPNLNTEIGQGSLDFKSIFSAAKSAGVKHYFVEHETNYKPNELDSVATSFSYVQNELF